MNGILLSWIMPMTCWHSDPPQDDCNPNSNLFDEYGTYHHRVYVQSSIQDPDPPIAEDDSPNAEDEIPDVEVTPISGMSTTPPDCEALRPYFGWISPKLIQQTLDQTTQFARIPTGNHLKRFYKSPNPALNVHRRDEPVACDIVYSDTPAIDNGATSAAIFVGCHAYVTDVYSLKTDKQFVNALEDNIRFRGAPNKLISDRGQVEIGKKVLDILRALFISSWQSEPHHQHQNFAERRFQTVKAIANRILDYSGAPASTWFL